MSITSQDVKLFQSESLTDLPDGGGPMSSNEVVDGELNNLFTDLSDLDRVLGRVSMRKAYLAITTDNRDVFLGANAIITNPPADDSVGVVMFTTNSFSDRRSDARERVERYLVAGPRSTLYLYDTNLAGQRQILAYQRTTDSLPEVGETLVLSVEDVSESLDGTQQFVRVESVQSSRQEFFDGSGPSAVPYTKAVLTIGITTALEHDFPGGEVMRNPQVDTSPTKIRKSNIADGANYFGVVKLAEDIEPGDSTIKVEGILQAIIPSATDETAILDIPLGPNTLPPVAAGPEFEQALGTVPLTGGVATVIAVRAIMPGTASFHGGSAASELLLSDNGDGTMTRSGGGASTVGATGAIDYPSGQVTLSGVGVSSLTTSTLSFVPAAFVSNVSHTSGEEITQINRGQVRVATLDPRPAPSSVIVSYRALGRWYDLVDNGGGQITGPAGTGSGTINYATGSLGVTLGFEPDIGSHVLYAWGTGVHYAQRLDDALFDVGSVGGFLAAGQGLVPGTVEITWTDGGDKTAEDDGEGNITGDATGTVRYASGEIRINPDSLLAPSTVFTVTADRKAITTETPATTPSGGNELFTLTGTPIQAGSVRLVAIYTTPGGVSVSVEFRDNGTNFVQTNGNEYFIGLQGNGATRGVFNGTTGSCSIPTTIVDGYYGQNFSTSGGGYAWSPEAQNLTFAAISSVQYIDADGSASSSGTPVSSANLVIDFSPGLTEGIVAGSVLFTLNGRTYYDNAGILQYRSGASNVDAGTIDYGTGQAVLTSWISGAKVATVDALLTVLGQWPMTNVIWRTQGAPIRNGSFIATYQQAGDDPDNATSDSDGDIVGPNIAGASTINYSTGVYAIQFTAPVLPALSRYNAVVITFLPLDPSLIGLDPVRLPLDGRVPIIRPANVLVIHNTQYTTLTNPVSGATPYSLGRGQLSYAIVRDADGVLVPTTKWTSDLDAGEVEFGAPLDLTGYPQPLVVEHRIEDRVLCTDAQLSGDLTIFGAIGHEFDADGTFVSSALLFDRADLEARAYNLIEQGVWTGVWSDELIGSPSTGQYDSVNFPILVTNAGATKERWRFVFTNSNAGNLIGETVGQILSAVAISGTIAPINPATGEPYFTISPGGWGSGWVAGNVIRFNTDACGGSIWFLRCTLPGEVETPTDEFRVQLRGNAN